LDRSIVFVGDDDFRVARPPAKIVDAINGLAVVATVNNVADAHAAAAAGTIDLALFNVYLPDGWGVDLIADFPCDAMVVTPPLRAILFERRWTRCPLGLLVKPFPR
jgi:two-component system CitB family response regulator